MEPWAGQRSFGVTCLARRGRSIAVILHLNDAAKYAGLLFNALQEATIASSQQQRPSSEQRMLTRRHTDLFCVTWRFPDDAIGASVPSSTMQARRAHLQQRHRTRGRGGPEARWRASCGWRSTNRSGPRSWSGTRRSSLRCASGWPSGAPPSVQYAAGETDKIVRSRSSRAVACSASVSCGYRDDCPSGVRTLKWPPPGVRHAAPVTHALQ